jgi:hypothetical protein
VGAHRQPTRRRARSSLRALARGARHTRGWRPLPPRRARASLERPRLAPPAPLNTLPRSRAQSGIDVSDELLALYEEVKLRHKHKYFIFSLKQTGAEGNKTVWGWQIDHKSDAVPDDKNLEAFAEVVKQLPADEARFVVFDFTETKADGRMIKKLLLIKWCV